MTNEELYKGYDESFLSTELEEHKVLLPEFEAYLKNDIKKTAEFADGVIPYFNYSLVLSATRKFAYFAACNIDGVRYQKAPRKDAWRLDKRIEDAQWGYELYGSKNAKFDRGHLAKREDTQWGDTVALAFKAADSTFFYTNSVPQHKDLNRDVWRSLEDYVLHAQTTKRKLRVCVFTGPVLNGADPFFCDVIREENVKLPVLFWKVVYYVKEDQKLYRVGFLMGQQKLLEDHNLIEQLESEGLEDLMFLTFKKAGTYQVNVPLIEELTGLKFSKAMDPYIDSRSKELIFQEVDIDPDLESDSLEQTLGYSILNVEL